MRIIGLVKPTNNFRRGFAGCFLDALVSYCIHNKIPSHHSNENILESICLDKSFLTPTWEITKDLFA